MEFCNCKAPQLTGEGKQTSCRKCGHWYSEEVKEQTAKAVRDFKAQNKPNKIQRNDGCPCGSGKKVKKCCPEKVGSRVSDADYFRF